MSSESATIVRLPGIFVTIDGPGGVGKSTVVRLIAEALADRAVPMHITTEPGRTPLGELIRHGTYTYRGMALACLVAGNRHHHMSAEVLPALQEGRVVLCDRYLPSSLVLQGLMGSPQRSSGNSTGAATCLTWLCCSTLIRRSLPTVCMAVVATADLRRSPAPVTPNPIFTAVLPPNCTRPAGR